MHFGPKKDENYDPSSSPKDYCIETRDGVGQNLVNGALLLPEIV
jgi:hypothetical protein